jgi:hypothetical protein
MPRINATRAEHARQRAKARQASNAQREHYAQPGVWQAEHEGATGALQEAIAQGDDKAAQRARNSLIVMGLYRPKTI